MSSVVEHDEEQREYRLRVDAAPVSYLGYERRDDEVVLSHTATDPAHQGRGYATTLVAEVLADLEGTGLRTVARCPFVRAYQRRTGTADVQGPGPAEPPVR